MSFNLPSVCTNILVVVHCKIKNKMATSFTHFSLPLSLIDAEELRRLRKSRLSLRKIEKIVD